ncbi:hypothetical protein [Roseomonas indoligenes]|uniref:Uncharacterized protein n=1 Tax=Roseomonas indoligenes TaxID=2820811 RepID=A0A940S422_9PROT|nr:hypothetical protein [Pararoseomonas indoligenes]MBP0491534.1 hypothetical protein [Pararoseomonas indoligenes]
MPVFADGRIPVLIVTDEAALAASLSGGGKAALLAEERPAALPTGIVASAGFEPGGTHPVACTCCAGRVPMAQALDALFLDRVKGRAPWFDRVVALLPSPDRRAELDVILHLDGVVSARYRPG